MANDGDLFAVDVDDSEFGVAGRDCDFCCTEKKSMDLAHYDASVPFNLTRAYLHLV